MERLGIILSDKVSGKLPACRPDSGKMEGSRSPAADGKIPDLAELFLCKVAWPEGEKRIAEQDRIGLAGRGVQQRRRLLKRACPLVEHQRGGDLDGVTVALGSMSRRAEKA